MGKYANVCFIDSERAFDEVNHNISPTFSEESGLDKQDMRVHQIISVGSLLQENCLIVKQEENESQENVEHVFILIEQSLPSSRYA